MPGTLRISRRGHRRRGYRRESGVYVHPADVPGVIYRARDRGLPGRGPKVIPELKKGTMINQAVKLGYITKGQTISDIPKSKIDDFAIDLAKSVGYGKAMKMINVQVIFRKNQPNGFKSKMIVAKNALRRKSQVLKVVRK